MFIENKQTHRPASQILRVTGLSSEVLSFFFHGSCVPCCLGRSRSRAGCGGCDAGCRVDVVWVRCGRRRGGVWTSSGCSVDVVGVDYRHRQGTPCSVFGPSWGTRAVIWIVRCLTNPRRPRLPQQTRAGGHGFRGPRVAGRLLPRPVRGRRHLLPVSPRVTCLCVCVLISLEDSSHVGSDPARGLTLARPPLGPGFHTWILGTQFQPG